MFWLSCLPGIASALVACKTSEMAKDFPVGVCLGPNHITSAYITSTNEVVTVASVEASQEWNSFFLNTLRIKLSNDEQRKYADEMGEEEILNSSLSQIRRATEEKLGRSVEIHAIGYPEHFKNVPCGTKLLNTAIKAESVPEIKDMMQMGLYLHYIRLAYEPFSSEALGYPPETDQSDFHTLLLYIDYKKDFLQVSIMEVAGPLSVRDRFFRMDNFGGSDNIASPEDLADFKVRFQNLLDEQIRDNQYCQTNPEDFRFIISSGEASSSEFQKVREAIVAVVPEFSDRFLHLIDPFWVSAVGAAYRAKECFLDPPDTKKWFDRNTISRDAWKQQFKDWKELRRRGEDRHEEL